MEREVLYQCFETPVEAWSMKVQLFRPSYDSREAEAVASVLETGWTGPGPRTAAFEKLFADFCSVYCCVGLSSGTAALEMALQLLGIGTDHEVIVPSVTFVSTAHCVVNTGARPVFADVCGGTHNIDPDAVSQLITERTRAVIAVHLGGYPADMDRLTESARGIPLIEDCAHAAGTLFGGRPAGSIGIAGCFSFHAVKNISMGEGGALVTSREDFFERAHGLKWLGIDRNTWERSNEDGGYRWEYRVREIGTNRQMDDIHAAIGIVQLEKLAGANARRREIAGLYGRGLAGLDAVALPPEEKGDSLSSWHMYRIEAERRDELNAFLSERGIQTGVHYRPLHLYSCYGSQPSLPEAERAFEKTLSLPMYPDLTDEQVQMVIECIREFYFG